MQISIIVAVAENGVIGRDGQLPWHLSEDLKRFKRLTTGHAIVMGRKTWESIGRPLPGRRSIVVTRQTDYKIGFADVAIVSSLDAALERAETAGAAEAFVIGGAEIFRGALPQADRLYLTRVLAKVEGDVFFPELDDAGWILVESQLHAADANNDYPQRFEVYDCHG